MKFTNLSLLVLLGIVLAWEAYAQQQTGQEAAQQPQSSTSAKQYKQGEAYDLGDVVALNDQGNRLSVELAQSTGASIGFKIKIFGPFEILVYTLGDPDNSDIRLLIGEQRISPANAYFTDEIVCDPHEPTLVSHFEMQTRRGIAYFSDTTHPLLVQFEIPADLSKATQKLEINSLTIGKEKYSLILNVSK